MASGKWIVLDSNTREVYGVFSDGHDPIQVARFSPDDRFLALGSRDNVIYVYQVSEDGKKFNRIGRCMVSSLSTSLYSVVVNTLSPIELHRPSLPQRDEESH